MKELVTEEIKEFLKTEEGDKIFEEITKPRHRQNKYDMKQAYVNPASNILRWIEIDKKVRKELNKCKKKS